MQSLRRVKNADVQAEIERVEKLVAKMQKKSGVLAAGDDEAQVEPKEGGGAKEPFHSKSYRLRPLATSSLPAKTFSPLLTI